MCSRSPPTGFADSQGENNQYDMTKVAQTLDSHCERLDSGPRTHGMRFVNSESNLCREASLEVFDDRVYTIWHATSSITMVTTAFVNTIEAPRLCAGQAHQRPCCRDSETLCSTVGISSGRQKSVHGQSYPKIRSWKTTQDVQQLYLQL